LRLKTTDTNTSGLLITAQFPKASPEDQLSPEKADALRRLAERIRALGEQQTELTLAIGKALISAKVRISDRSFAAWTRKEFGMANETACSYIALAKQNTGAAIELVAWDRADPKTSDGVCGYATVVFGGQYLHNCPVFFEGPNGPFIQPVQSSPFKVVGAHWKEEYNEAVIKQIREVDPSCGLGIGATSQTAPD
jgi:hypothetical protein